MIKLIFNSCCHLLFFWTWIHMKMQIYSRVLQISEQSDPQQTVKFTKDPLRLFGSQISGGLSG